MKSTRLLFSSQTTLSYMKTKCHDHHIMQKADSSDKDSFDEEIGDTLFKSLLTSSHEGIYSVENIESH
jgi:hypothetical protein